MSGPALRALTLVLCAIAGSAGAASAQTPVPRVEVAAGVLWIGSQPLGDRSATETTGSGSTVPLFHTTSELAAAAGFEGRVGVRLIGGLVAEVMGSFGKPQLRIAVSGDSENSAPVTATETVQQFTIGAGVVWYLPGRPRRVAPFVTAGGGYLRQLHTPATLVETGRFYQVGGGITAVLASGRRIHAHGIGIRADARAMIRSQGVAFDGGSATSPAAGLSAFVRF